MTPLVHPRSLPLRKQSSGLVRGNPWSPSWGWTLRTGPFQHNSFPTVWNHRDPPSRVTQCLASRTSQKAMPGNEWGDLQTNEISHFSVDGVPDRSAVGTHSYYVCASRSVGSTRSKILGTMWKISSDYYLHIITWTRPVQTPHWVQRADWLQHPDGYESHGASRFLCLSFGSMMWFSGT